MSCVVIGGGISGLSAALAHQDAGCDVTVLDAGDQPGGVLQSTTVDGIPRNHSAQSIVLTPELDTHLRRWGLRDEIVDAPELARIRCIVYDGRVRRLISPAHAFLTRLLPLRSLGNILRKFNKSWPGGDPSVADVVRYYADDVVLHRLVAPVIRGIYAGDAERLSFMSCFPGHAQSLVQAGSPLALITKRKRTAQTSRQRRLTVPHAGMSAFISRFASGINTLQSRCTVDSISAREDGWAVSVNGSIVRAHKLVIATGAQETSRLLAHLDTHLCAALDRVDHASLRVVHCSFDDNATARQLHAYGALWADDGSVRGILDLDVLHGRSSSRHHVVAFIDVGADIYEVHHAINSLYMVRGEVSVDHEVTWTNVIPQYGMDHQHLAEKIQRFERSHTSIRLIGNFIGGVSIADRIQQGVMSL